MASSAPIRVLKLFYQRKRIVVSSPSSRLDLSSALTNPLLRRLHSSPPGISLIRIPQQFILVDQNMTIMEQNLVTRFHHKNISSTGVIRTISTLSTEIKQSINQ